ncbi:hypothetical protein CO2235_MP20214 [Cupriavidus oxalaticus]|uniref:Uncharacterized protein n=1 Tax=Cupriavidus oxalaticus TaxID=96344 RepID=A0A375GKH8_9BURK|nr:hypothetical protein CO2235_MP20214 [Cupriavidus oxalaticus]
MARNRTQFCAAKKNLRLFTSAYPFLRRTRFCVGMPVRQGFGMRTNFCGLIPGRRGGTRTRFCVDSHCPADRGTAKFPLYIDQLLKASAYTQRIRQGGALWTGVPVSASQPSLHFALIRSTFPEIQDAVPVSA